ncbi:FecR family protein [Pedobacter sp. ok626]|uniref:FecR family protein n=1 Tax=Pedobacter sp. ok626 TaxID=1761882 RepID=UPI00088D67A4|nr:FecR domain-containing protein [Pedobacter sp. ok626]SDL16511.1 FecR family protein [Pedobacter sp. ok626]
MTTKEDFQTLIDNYQNGNCTQREAQQLENWYNEKANNNPDREFPENFWQEKEEGLQQILGFEPGKEGKGSVINWPLNILLIAATLAIVGTFSTMFFKRIGVVPITQQMNDVDPGGNKATLTLQNGKRIQLSDAKTGIVVDASKLTYNDGTLINNEQAQSFTISTPRGGTYQVRLPDGSTAWLNAASSLTYNPSLKGEEQYRNVKLSGEAYFEVAKDKKHPFVVTTDKQRIEVLGTHFNVSAYNDELSVKTTLLEGSVKVAPFTTTGSDTKEVILKPNQESEITSSGISVHKVYADDAIDWKNGEFSFTRERLGSIMRKIARWYDVDIIYTDKQIVNRTFSGFVSKYKKASQVLCLLEQTGDVKFKIEGRRITVMR